MSLATFIIGNPTTFTGSAATWPRFYIATTSAELPTSGLVEGSLGFSVTDDKLWKTTSATSWTEVGAGGAPGSVDVKQTEIDFGTTPVSEASFLIVDGDVSAGSQLIGSVAYEAPTGKDLDELEMDGLDLKFAPGAGSFTLYVRGMDGYIADKFKINYLIG